jgi:hypothetical protein
MACIHGLPGWCLNCAGKARPEKPEFRRRRPEDEVINYGDSRMSMRDAMVSQSRFGRLDVTRSTWRDDMRMRDIAELVRKMR